jgi:hypothetical protein
MPNCKAVYGISNVCSDLLQASGVDKDFYVGYVSDLSTKLSLTQTGAISSFSFLSYMGLVKFEGQKFAHSFSHELMVGAGGSISYKHLTTVKLMPLSTQDDVEIQRLSQAQDAFFVMQGNNEDFYILGPSKGMRAVAGAMRTSGVAAGEDVTTSLSFEGNEKVVPLRFSLGTTTQAIINYLDGLVR